MTQSQALEYLPSICLYCKIPEMQAGRIAREVKVVLPSGTGTGLVTSSRPKGKTVPKACAWCIVGTDACTYIQLKHPYPGVVVHPFHPRAQKAEVRDLFVVGQLALREALSQTTKPLRSQISTGRGDHSSSLKGSAN